MASIPKTQKAVIFNTKTNALSFETNFPVTHSPSELLIHVHAAAITNKELTWAPFVNWPELHVPCYDAVGTVVALPTSPSVSHSFKIGDLVWGRIDAGREGSAQEYANILPSEAALLPKNLNVTDAAMGPMSAHTAWQAVFEKGLLTGSFTPTSVPHIDSSGKTVLDQAKGKRVLILGAAGGVGLFAVQFAKLAGAYVVGTASGKNEAFLKSLGIDETIDYTKTSVEEWVAKGNEKFDLVFDCVGGKSMLDGWKGIKENGKVVSVVPGFSEPEGGKPAGVESIFFIMQARGEELAAIGKFFEKGMLKTSTDSIWKLEECDQAFARTASGHARGKVVFKISDA